MQHEKRESADMKAVEIRAIRPGKSCGYGVDRASSGTDAILMCAAMLQEIAAQFAEFNARLEQMTDSQMASPEMNLHVRVHNG